MPNGGEIPPLDPAESLYRRVQEKDFDPAKSPYPEHLAFRPNEHDTDGISLFRERMTEAKGIALARAKPGKRYYVAEIPVSEFHRLGLTVATDDLRPPTVSDPIDPTHVVIPELNAATRREDRTRDLAQQLARSPLLKMHGPYSL